MRRALIALVTSALVVSSASSLFRSASVFTNSPMSPSTSRLVRPAIGARTTTSR